jgi:hypothetical protein
MSQVPPHHQSDSYGRCTKSCLCGWYLFSFSCCRSMRHLGETEGLFKFPKVILWATWARSVSEYHTFTTFLSIPLPYTVIRAYVWGFSTKASYSFVISTKELFVKTVLWSGGSSDHSGSENVHIIIGSQSAECPIQQAFCLLGRIRTPFLRCRLFLNDCHLYDLISQRPLTCQHLSAVSIKCFSCNTDVQYCNSPYLWILFYLTSCSSWCPVCGYAVSC